LRRLAHEAAHTFAFQVATSVFDLATVVVASRLLGPAGRGQFVFVMLTASILTFLCSPGLTYSIVYHAGKEPGQRRALVANAVVAALGFGLLAVGVGIGVSVLPWSAHLLTRTQTSAHLMWIGAAAVPSYLLFQNANSVLRGWGLISTFNTLQLIRGILAFVALLVLVAGLELGVEGAVWSYLVAMTVTALLTLAVVGRIEPLRLRAFSLPFLRDKVRYGRHTYLWNLAAFAEQRAGLLITGGLMGPTALGLLSVATNVGERLRDLADVMVTVLFPRIARAADKQDFRVSVVAIRQMSLTLFAAGIALLIAAPMLLRVLFGNRFDGSLIPLLILIPGMMVRGLGRVIAYDLAARGSPHLGARAAQIAALLLVTLAPVGIHFGGLVGVALATNAACFGFTAFVTVQFLRMSHLPMTAILFPSRYEMRQYPGLLRSAAGGMRALSRSESELLNEQRAAGDSRGDAAPAGPHDTPTPPGAP